MLSRPTFSAQCAKTAAMKNSWSRLTLIGMRLAALGGRVWKTIMVVIDTHILIWFFSRPAMLSSRAAKAVAEAEKLIIPSIVLWEIAMLAERNRISIPRPWMSWLKRVCGQAGFQIQPITPEIAFLSATLEMHRDPADRLVVATAKALDLPLISADRKIQDSGLVATIW